MDLALELHKTLPEVIESTSSTEFVDWQVKLDRRRTEVTKENWYAAQVAALLHNFNVDVRAALGSKKPGKYVSVQDCLVKWKSSEDDQVSKSVDQDHGPVADEPEPLEPEAVSEEVRRRALEAAERSKAIWGGWIEATWGDKKSGRATENPGT